MILAIVLTSVTVGALAGAALVRAWVSGALEDERARSERLESELVAARAENTRLRKGDPTQRLLADVRRGLGRHRKGVTRR